ncbi:MAG: hypothetical protein JO022_22335 [Acidobacteriaceae bacterium]|nr:hypothetical protein [Acidobacteriaceae bacterium]
MIRTLGALSALALVSSAASAQGPTYAKEVSRIIQAKCQMCHRDGDIAPFSLNNYDDAVTWSDDIKRVLNLGIMPPWKPVPGYGDFRDSYALSDDEKQTILSWIAGGTELGDPNDLPSDSVQAGPWPLGTPDVTLQVPAAFTPDMGKDVYRCFVLPDAGFADTTYLSAIDILPGNRQIVHHVLIFQDTTGTAAQMDGADGNPGYDCFGGPGIPVDYSNIFGALDSLGGMAGWAPGQRTHLLPDGVGIQIKQGARIVIQVHYHPIGRTGPDQTQVGLYLMQSQIQKRLYQIPVVNMTFQVQPETVQDVTAVFPPFPLPISAQAITIYPHMHLLGTHIKADLIDQHGNVTPMIYEDNWDFNWQGAYTYLNPIPIPTYSKVKVTCTFDNTSSNPKNPNNPVVAVGWGERTVDEMCLAFVGVTLDVDPFTVLNQIRPVKQ